MRKDTQRRIDIYTERIPHIKEKLGAAGMGLLIAAIVATSATFAWITLSRAPEVKNISTNLSANGSLEIALSDETGKLPEEYDIDESRPINTDNVTVSNLQWGNLINLSDKSYGIDSLPLRPAKLNNGALLTNPLQAAVYGSDGRITLLNTNYAYAKYDNGSFVTSGKDYFGVRAIASYTADISAGTAAEYEKMKQAVMTAQQKVQQVYSDPENGVAKKFGAMGSLISAYAQVKVDIKLGTRPDGDPGPNLAKYLTQMGASFKALKNAMEAQKDAYVALANYQIYMHAQNNQIPFEATTWAELEKNPSKYNVAKATDVSKHGVVSLVGLSTFITDYNNVVKDIGYIDRYYNDYKTNGTEYMWSKGGESGYQIYNFVARLVDYGSMQIVDANGNRKGITSLGTSDTGLFGKQTQVYVQKGILIRFEQLAVNETARLNGRASCTVTLDLSASGLYGVEHIYGKAYTDAAGPAYFELNANNSFSGTSLAVNDMVAEDTYGMAVDFWVRTNAEQTCLTLEGAVVKDEKTGEILRYDGVNRVWGRTAEKGVLTTESTTQGGGSCYIFYADTPNDEAKSTRLLEAMKVVFVDQNGNLLATADMDTTQKYAQNGRYTVPLVLDRDTQTKYTYTDEENNQREGRAITTLYTDQPQRITAIIYLNGDLLTNNDVLSAAEIQGQLNLQFGSSVDLKTIGNNDLINKTRTVTARVSKNTMDYDNAVTTEDLTTNVFVDVNGADPSTMTAFFVRAINSTQGSRENTMTFTKQEDGSWLSSYTFDAPGTYYLRYVRMDGVDYALSTVPKIEIEGFTVASVNWGETDDEVTIYSSESGYKETVEVKFATNKQEKMPKTVKASFVRSDGSEVVTSLSYSSSSGSWSGQASFSVSGVYTLKLLELDRKLIDLSVKNMDKTLDLKLGLWVEVINGKGATEDTVNEDGSHGDKYDESKTHEKDITVNIYDNANQKLKGIDGVRLYYSNSGSITNSVSTDLIWNEGEDTYEGLLAISKPGRYKFLSVQVLGSVLTNCRGNAPVYLVFSPDPPAFDTTSAATYNDKIQFAPMTFDAVIDHIRIENSSAATVSAVLYHEATQDFYSVSSTDGTMVYSEDGWIVRLPRYTTDLGSDGNPLPDAEYTQEGKWRLITVALSNCYDASGVYHADDNPIVWADNGNVADAYLSNYKITATQRYNFSRLSTTVSCTFNAAMEAGETKLGSSTDTFMSRYSVNGTGMYVKLTDDDGNVIPANKIKDVTLTLQYIPDPQNSTYGYKVQSGAAKVYEVKLNNQDNDTGRRTVSEVNGSVDFDWQYVGVYKVNSLKITVGTTTLTYTEANNIGVPDSYTVTTAGPSAENVSLQDENIKQRNLVLGKTGENVVGTFLQSHDLGITAKVSLATPDNSDTQYVVLEDVSMQLEMNYKKGGTQKYGGYTYSGTSDLESISQEMTNTSGLYSSKATPLLAGQYAVDLKVTVGSSSTTKTMQDVTVYSKAPTVKVANTSPDMDTAFNMTSVTGEAGRMWENAEKNLTEVKNYYSEYLAAVYIKAESNEEYEGFQLQGTAIVNYTLPTVTLRLSNVENANFDTAVFTINNEMAAAKPNRITFQKSALEQTSEVGYIENVSVDYETGKGCGTGKVTVQFEEQKPTGEQTVRTIAVKRGNVTYTVSLSNNVVIREKSVAPPSIQLAEAEGYLKVNGQTSVDGGSFQFTLPSTIGQKDGTIYVTNNASLDKWHAGTPVTTKYCYFKYEKLADTSGSSGSCGNKKTWTNFNGKYTYYPFVKTVTTYTSDELKTTECSVKLGVTGWKIGDKTYLPGETITVDKVMTATPVIGELPGTRVELKTSTKILTYDHVVIEAEAGKNPTVVKVSCKSTDKPPKNNAEYLKSEAVYTSKKPAGYEWMDANHPDQVITPQDYKTETIEKVS